ncbi:MAG TPA: lysophospholipid acyltransferase family protein [Planctomycetota bacterium]|nr:lysophospholipid acyltransferase family protein [Planctomycetota bacterium]
MSRAEKFRLHEVRPVQFLLYLLLRSVVMVIAMFPYSSAPAIARLLGMFVRLIDRKHVRIAAKNLQNSGDLCPPARIPEFITRVYEHVALGFVEMLMTPRMIERRELLRHVTLVNFEKLAGYQQEGRGVILTIGHQGNWEMCGLVVLLRGYRLNVLARPIDNPWIDRYLNRFRTLTGQRVMSRDRALGEMIRVLQGNGLLVIQMDQDARQSGVFVNFFGRPASTHRSPAVLSLKYGAPIVPVNVYREGPSHTVIATEPIFPAAFRDHPDPTKALTQAMSDRFEEFVRQHPEQWFWIHDRWKTAERSARATTEALV